jgi:hypothetical protein
MNEVALLVQHPGSISQTEAGDVETDGIDSDDDNDVLQKSDQVCRLYIHTTCCIHQGCPSCIESLIAHVLSLSSMPIFLCRSLQKLMVLK